MKLFSKLNLLTLALGGVLILGVPAVKADSTNQQSTATLNIQDESTDTTAKLSLYTVMELFNLHQMHFNLLMEQLKVGHGLIHKLV